MSFLKLLIVLLKSKQFSCTSWAQKSRAKFPQIKIGQNIAKSDKLICEVYKKFEVLDLAL